MANTVETFTYCLLDPLKDGKYWRELFGDFVLDPIIDDAIDLDQKKVILNCRNLKGDLQNFGSKSKNYCTEILKPTWFLLIFFIVVNFL